MVYVSLGSNIDPHKHIKNAAKRLQNEFQKFRTSSIYESASIGFEGENFLNSVVSFETTMSPEKLYDYLHSIEDDAGRVRLNGKAWDSRTLDLDIMLFDGKVGSFGKLNLPSEEIENYAHVFLPLMELAPEIAHPVSGERYKELVNPEKFKQEKIRRLTS